MIIERTVGDFSLVIFLRTVVGIELRSQDELDNWYSKLVISSMVAGVKEVREGGMRNIGRGGRRVGLKNEVKF